ncbi:LOW QUALITY PROTEIN: uncharacterized protein AAHN32_005421 [Aegotheles albertisi]
MAHNTADPLYVLTEAMKLSFTDAFSICADPDKVLVQKKSLVGERLLQTMRSMSFRVMGRFMPPQGQAQVLLNMLEFGMNPQQALAAAWPRLNSSVTDIILIHCLKSKQARSFQS